MTDEQTKQCLAEVQAVLDKYGCQLAIQSRMQVVPNKTDESPIILPEEPELIV